MLKINNVEYDYLQGHQYKDSLTSELHSRVVTLSTNEKPTFKRFDIAEFEDGKWVVSTKNIASVGQKYRTTTTLVELTYILEKYILPANSLTNAADTLLEQIEKLFNKVDTLKVGETTRFKLTQRMVDFLMGKPGEDFTFSERLTLREALDEMLSAYGVRADVVVLTNNLDEIIIDYLDLNYKSNTTYSFNNVFSEEDKTDAQYYANEFDIQLQNAETKRKMISIQGWQPVKPIDLGIVSNIDFKLVVDRPINELVKVEVKYLSSIPYTLGEATFNLTRPVKLDITSLFVEKEIYDYLDIEEQENYIPFQRGSTQIGVLDTFKNILFTVSKLETYVSQNLYEPVENYLIENNIEYDSINYNEIVADWVNFRQESLYQITYVPYIDLHLKYSKDKDNINKKITSIFNQTDRNIDVDRFNQSTRNVINMVGNEELVREVKVQDYSELLPLGSRLDDGYSLVVREMAIFDNFIKCKYTFIKDYTTNSSARLSRERRLYNIPQENLIDRDVLLKDNLLVSVEPVGVENDGLLSDDALKYFLKTFNNALDDNRQINKLLVQTKDKLNNNYGLFSLNFSGFAFGKSMIWNSKMLDNYSVGLSTATKTIGGRLVHANPYVDQFGEFETMSLRFIKDNIDNASFENQLAVGRTLPVIPLQMINVYTHSNHTRNQDVNFKIFKDRLEVIGITYQLEAKSISDKVLIGNHFSDYSNLLFGKNETKLYVWVSPTEEYNYSDLSNCKGTKTAIDFMNVDETNIRIYTNYTQVPNMKSWAIGTEDGKLVLAINNNFQDIKSIYFGIFRNK